MNPKTKVKVRVADLLEALRAKQDEADAAHERAMLKFADDLAAYQAEALKFLGTRVDKHRQEGDEKIAEVRRKVTEQIDAMFKLSEKVNSDPFVEVNRNIHYNYGEERGPETPYKPQKRSFASAIRQLEMAADEAILISAEDFAEYLR